MHFKILNIVAHVCSLYLWLHGAALFAQPNPRSISLDPSVDRVETLAQNWTDEESNWFYNVPQGSRLLPYRWMLHLEQPDAQSLFLDAAHMRRLGFLPRLASSGNPDGLPIGLVKDASYDDGTEGMGITCAACHTGLVTHRRTAYLIDGGPTMNDTETFLIRLAQSLEQTANDDEKFLRFAKRVLSQPETPSAKDDLREALRSVARQRSDYNARNTSKGPWPRFGHGRIDAFGAIFNEVSTTFIGRPDNVRPANAPVSFPCLWDAPQHDRVQWNGAAENKKSVLGLLLFGTQEVGALGRNTGEVLGVFGNVQVHDHELILPRRYEATANKANLQAIETSLKSLWSPKWPDAFGLLDADKVARGRTLYVAHCQECHNPIDRDDANRKVIANISDVKTDSMFLENFRRSAKTGKLQGRRKTLFNKDRFGEDDAAAILLRHVVERVMLNPITLEQLKSALENPLAELNSLNPGFDTTVVIKVGDKSATVSLDSVESLNGSLKVLGSPKALKSLSDQLGLENVPAGVMEIPRASATAGYKARPLNGIWATAPYLHNGSVRTLADLLKPSAQREATFHVGSTEFDPAHVGFVDDSNYPVFDTSQPGNSNRGHEFGVELTRQEKLDLLEYLKSE